jgi:hypothetical protein
MPNILVLQPARPSNPPALRARADALIERMVASNPAMAFDIGQENVFVVPPPNVSRYTPHAAARNYMLDRFLKADHTHVLWIDSDLIDYPADLPARLLRVEDAIVAPLAMLDASPDRLLFDPHPDRFYDIGGFIEAGRRASYWPPHFVQRGDVIDLDSVGCCYLAPAQLYRDGVRYATPPTDYFVEHWSVCQAAKRRGYRVCALTNVRVVHAWLPDYGLELN